MDYHMVLFNIGSVYKVGPQQNMKIQGIYV